MSTNLAFQTLSTGQSNKEAAVNTALGQFDAAITEVLDLDFVAGNINLTAAQLRGAIRFRCTNVTVARDLNLPASIKRGLIFVRNNSGNTANVSVKLGTAVFVIQPGQTQALFVDGTTNGVFRADQATIADLFDFVITTPADNDEFRYEAATAKWKNKPKSTFNGQTGNYTLVLADYNGVVSITNAAGRALTVPANSSAAFPIGTEIEVIQGGAGPVTITPDTGVTVNALSGTLASAGQYQKGFLRKIGTDTWNFAWLGTGVGGGGGGALSGLSDVQLTSPANGDVLLYDTALSKWKNSAASGGASAVTATRPTVVQSVVASSTTPGVTFGAAPTAGNLLVAIGTHFANGMTPAAGWSQLQYQNGASVDGSFIFFKIARTGESTTQTFATAGAGTFAAGNFVVYEIANYDPIYPFDNWQVKIEQTGTSVNIVCASGFPTALQVGLVATTGTSSLPTLSGSATAGATQTSNTGSSGNPRGVSEFRTNIDATSFTQTATWGASVTSYILTLTIRPKVTTNINVDPGGVVGQALIRRSSTASDVAFRLQHPMSEVLWNLPTLAGAGFTTGNIPSGGSIVDDATVGGINFFGVATAGANKNMWARTAKTGAFTAIACIRVLYPHKKLYMSAGIWIADTATNGGRYESFVVSSESEFTRYQFGNNASGSNDENFYLGRMDWNNTFGTMWRDHIWLRVVVDGSNVKKWSISYNGVDWIYLGSSTTPNGASAGGYVAGSFTTATHVGVVFNCNSPTGSADGGTWRSHLVHWSLT